MKYTKEYIKQKVTTEELWTERALVALYNRQTNDEQDQHTTRHQNRIGFNGFDAKFLSKLAEQILCGKHLSEKQLLFAQKAIGKYAGQLCEMANANAKLT